MVLYDVEEKRRIVVPIDDQAANSAVQTFIINYNERLLGLDCEWASTDCLALIQIATKEHVILFQTCRFEDEHILPELLSDILQNERIIKVGVNIEEDVRRIHLQFDETVRMWLDLRCLAVKQRFSIGGHGLILQQFKDFEADLVNVNNAVDVKAKRSGFMPKLGLEALVEHFLRQTLPKSKYLQVFGDWEAFLLSRELKLYAAADAAAAYDVYVHLGNVNWNIVSRRKQAEERGFKYPPYIDYPDDFHWQSLYEEPYIHKEIRVYCLDWIASMAPEMRQVLPDYYGRSNRRSIGKVKTTQECVTARDNDNVRPRPQEENNCLVTIVASFITMLMLGIIGIIIYDYVTIKTTKDFTLSLMEKLEVILTVLQQKMESFVKSTLKPRI